MTDPERLERLEREMVTVRGELSDAVQSVKALVDILAKREDSGDPFARGFAAFRARMERVGRVDVPAPPGARR